VKSSPGTAWTSWRAAGGGAGSDYGDDWETKRFGEGAFFMNSVFIAAALWVKVSAAEINSQGDFPRESRLGKEVSGTMAGSPPIRELKSSVERKRRAGA
jgi:hypothetical protein